TAAWAAAAPRSRSPGRATASRSMIQTSIALRMVDLPAGRSDGRRQGGGSGARRRAPLRRDLAVDLLPLPEEADDFLPLLRLLEYAVASHARDERIDLVDEVKRVLLRRGPVVAELEVHRTRVRVKRRIVR